LAPQGCQIPINPKNYVTGYYNSYCKVSLYPIFSSKEATFDLKSVIFERPAHISISYFFNFPQYLVGPARRLMEIIEKDPKNFLEMISGKKMA